MIVEPYHSVPSVLRDVPISCQEETTDKTERRNTRTLNTTLSFPFPSEISSLLRSRILERWPSQESDLSRDSHLPEKGKGESLSVKPAGKAKWRRLGTLSCISLSREKNVDMCSNWILPFPRLHSSAHSRGIGKTSHHHHPNTQHTQLHTYNNVIIIIIEAIASHCFEVRVFTASPTTDQSQSLHSLRSPAVPSQSRPRP